jgi:hypothetical protein
MAGDSVLAVFGTAHGAVSAALAIQGQINALAKAGSEGSRVPFSRWRPFATSTGPPSMSRPPWRPSARWRCWRQRASILDCLLYEVLTKARGGGHGRRLGTGGVWYRGSVRYRHGGPCGCSSALSPSPWHFKSMPDRPARHSNGLTERCMWSSSATSAFSPPILAGGGRLWVGNRKSGFPSQTCLQSALGELIFDAARPRPSATVVTAKSKANGRLELVRGSNRVATANEHPKHRISGIPLQLTMSTPRA